MSHALRLTAEQLAAIRKRVSGGPKKSPEAAPERAQTLPAPERVAKYRNEKTDGYHSKREATRAAELKLLEQGGKIQGLEEQVRYELIPAQYRDGRCVERSCTYVADFRYWEGDTLVVEDSKGYRTADYRIRKKLMLHVHNIRVRET